MVSSIQDIPLEKIRESKTNPRTQFDQSKLTELAENIRQHGVLQPILVRPLPKGAADTYELVAGARRYRASQLARRESIPTTVRELTDAQALVLQVIENVQRVDVHPLDEAQGYAGIIELQPETYTVESIAARVGRSPAYVLVLCSQEHITGENPPYGSATRKKQVCSVGGRPTEAKVRSLVAWTAGRREIEFPKPIDKAIFQDGEQVIGP